MRVVVRIRGIRVWTRNAFSRGFGYGKLGHSTVVIAKSKGSELLR
jgi:hypothetical protein